MVSLEGKTALVTGASSGIGRGIALGLAEAGATVGVNYPPFDGEAERAAAVVDEVEAGGETGVALEGDVRSAESIESMVRAFEDRFGAPDVLCNNAGIVTQSRLAEMPVETWDEMIQVNLRGVFLTTRFVLPGMLEAGRGSVVNTASQLGIKGAPELVHYSAAKGGIIAFTRALAREVSPTVRVNAVAPGPIETDLLADISEEWRAAKEAELPMGRLGQVDDVVPTVVFLASEESSYYTGQTLSPDGGDAMH
jgi:3-oxoacyl-[acyl-carrier protein] reductase